MPLLRLNLPAASGRQEYRIAFRDVLIWRQAMGLELSQPATEPWPASTRTLWPEVDNVGDTSKATKKTPIAAKLVSESRVKLVESHRPRAKVEQDARHMPKSQMSEVELSDSTTVLASDSCSSGCYYEETQETLDDESAVNSPVLSEAEEEIRQHRLETLGILTGQRAPRRRSCPVWIRKEIQLRGYMRKEYAATMKRKAASIKKVAIRKVTREKTKQTAALKYATNQAAAPPFARELATEIQRNRDEALQILNGDAEPRRDSLIIVLDEEAARVRARFGRPRIPMSMENDEDNTAAVVRVRAQLPKQRTPMSMVTDEEAARAAVQVSTPRSRLSMKVTNVTTKAIVRPPRQAMRKMKANNKCDYMPKLNAWVILRKIMMSSLKGSDGLPFRQCGANKSVYLLLTKHQQGFGEPVAGVRDLSRCTKNEFRQAMELVESRGWKDVIWVTDEDARLPTKLGQGREPYLMEWGRGMF